MRREFVHLTALMLAIGLVSLPLSGAKKKQVVNSQDPYATAEFDTAPAVSAADLAYRAVLFEDFTIPAQWEAKARPLVNSTQERAISRLTSTNAFTTVAKKQNQSLDEPYLVVKAALKDYRMVGGKGRFFAGVAAGTSYLTYSMQVLDGKTGSVLFEREITSENNAFAGTFSNSDKKLPAFLGNVISDYLALRARKDKGVSVLALEAPAAK